MFWLDERTLLVGRGYRTNDDGIEQIRSLLDGGIDVIAFDLPHFQGPDACLHLMSFISPLDHDLVVVYMPMMPVRLVALLREREIEFVEVPDDEFETQGPNVLALAHEWPSRSTGAPRLDDAWRRPGSTSARSRARRSRARVTADRPVSPAPSTESEGTASAAAGMLGPMYEYWLLLHILAAIVFAGCRRLDVRALPDPCDGARQGPHRRHDRLLRHHHAADVHLARGGDRRGVRARGAGKFLGYWWMWLAFAVLVVTTVLMTLTAKPYFQRITAACAIRPSCPG